MSTIRPLATIAILAAVGVFLAKEINKGPSHDAAELAEWGGAPAEPFTPETLTAPTGPTSPAVDSSLVTGAPPIGAPVFAPSPEAPADPPVLADPTTPPATATADAPGFAPIPSLPAVPSAPADPLADLPLPDSIPAATYDAPTTTPVAPAAGPSPAAFGRVYPPEESAAPVAATSPAAVDTLSLPPAPPIEAQIVPPTAPVAAAPPITPIAPLTTPVAPPTAPVFAGGFAAAKPAIDAALASNELSRALLMLSTWKGDPGLSPAERGEVDRLLSQLAGSVIYSNQHLLEGPYTVRPGDTLETVAQQYGVPWQLLGKINGVTNPALVQPGQVLKVVRGPFRATLDLSDNELVLQVDGRYAGRFPVTLGAAAPSEGSWRIEQKQDLAGKQLVLTGGLGKSTTISTQPGGVSVAARDLSDLYDILSVGSEVTVRR